jgi:mannose-1-phosphate guanylyltransferase
VATTKTLAAAVHDQLPHLPRRAVLAEPYPRNTAPCIGLAAVRILREDPEGTMVVLPADQVIAPDEAFQETLRAAAALVDEEPRRLITFGIKPTRASTGFGYIQRGPAAESGAAAAAGRTSSVYRVAKFHEKPKEPAAREYLAAGTYYWNSGIFLWRARTILDALARYQPGMFSQLEQIATAIDTPRFHEVLEEAFSAMPRISIDYAVMEQAEHVLVVEAPFQWDDVGSWPAWARYRPADEHDNRIDAPRHVEINADGNVVRSTEPGVVVVLAGARDLVVIVTPDAVLVADKHDEASIAAVTEELRKRGWEEHL